MRTFQTKAFARFARKNRLDGAVLLHTLAQIERGTIDADLGGGVIKQRIAREGGGKSGGYRALIVVRSGERAFFVHGFAKNERDNIRQDELMALKKLAAELLGYADADLAQR